MAAMRRNYTRKQILGRIQPIQCLMSMVWYYQVVYRAIVYFSSSEDELEQDDGSMFTRFSRDEINEINSYITSDLEHYSLEFYLVYKEKAFRCREKMNSQDETDREKHLKDAICNPAAHPCQMIQGFRDIVDDEKEGAYEFDLFLGQAGSLFTGIHAHLVSINRVLSDLYYFTTELPFSSFTPPGKNEIRRLTSGLNGIMRGLLVATHLQPQALWQSDIINYLITCRADCLRLIKMIDSYYHNHKIRLNVDYYESKVDQSILTEADKWTTLRICQPMTAGVYLDFLTSFKTIAQHTLAIYHWAIRLFSVFFKVPDSYERFISQQIVL